MARESVWVCVGILVLMISVSTVVSAGTLGKGYLAVSVGIISPKYGSEGTLYGAEFQIPVNRAVDVVGGLDRTEFKYTHATSFAGGLSLHGASPAQRIEAFVNVAAQVGIPEYGDKEAGYQIGGGIEANITEEGSAVVAANYTRLSDVDDMVVGFGANMWFGRRVLCGLSIARALDAENTVIAVEVGIGSF